MLHPKQSNAFTTEIGRLIEQQTANELASENWEQILHICDSINTSTEGPKDAMKAIKKRLTTCRASANHKSLWYALLILEACVKNCGTRFISHVLHKEFLGDLVKLLSPKYDPPVHVQEKIFSFFQDWIVAFRGMAGYKELEKVYLSLKERGIDFEENVGGLANDVGGGPRNTANSDAIQATLNKSKSIDYTYSVVNLPKVDNFRRQESYQPPPGSYPVQHTPPPQLASPYTTNAAVQSQFFSLPPNLHHLQHQQQQQLAAYQYAHAQSQTHTHTPAATEEQNHAKLKADLEVVQQNTQILRDMLQHFSVATSKASEIDLIQELHATCKSMQTRIAQLIESVALEDLVVQLLAMNDSLNAVFAEYERFERKIGAHDRSHKNDLTAATSAASASATNPNPYSSNHSAASEHVGFESAQGNTKRTATTKSAEAAGVAIDASQLDAEYDSAMLPNPPKNLYLKAATYATRPGDKQLIDLNDMAATLTRGEEIPGLPDTIAEMQEMMRFVDGEDAPNSVKTVGEKRASVSDSSHRPLPALPTTARQHSNLISKSGGATANDEAMFDEISRRQRPSLSGADQTTLPSPTGAANPFLTRPAAYPQLSSLTDDDLQTALSQPPAKQKAQDSIDDLLS